MGNLQSKNRQSLLDVEQARIQKALEKRMKQKATRRSTEALPDSDKLPAIGTDPFRNRHLDLDYKRLPERTSSDKAAIRWLIQLQPVEMNTSSLGFELVDDVVMGRDIEGSRNSDQPDMGLSVFNAHEKGVSRRHAMLRPTRNSLFIIDLESTNGTKLNACSIGRGTARKLSHDDLITLGDLSFTIKIIEKP